MTSGAQTRRDWLWLAAGRPLAGPAASSGPRPRLAVPVHCIQDARAHHRPERGPHFWATLWSEAANEYSRGGIDLQTTDGEGEIRVSPADNPIFVGLRRGALNLVVTDTVPMYWDEGRALAGVTTIHEGYHVCLIALRYAHGNQAPYISVNTCVHEMLHALLGDIFLKAPPWYRAGWREFRVDWYATRLWLFHDGAAIRESGEVYLRRLRASGG